MEAVHVVGAGQEVWGTKVPQYDPEAKPQQRFWGTSSLRS